MVDIHRNSAETMTKFIWAINDISKVASKNKASIKSPEFVIDGEGEMTCCVTLSSNEDWLEPSVELETKCHVADVVLSINFCIMDLKFRQVEKKSVRFFSRRCMGGRPIFQKYLNKKKLFDGDSTLFYKGDFVLCLEITLKEVSREIRTSILKKTENLAECNLRKSMASLLENKYFCDFVIVVKGKEYWCNKFVLACRCEYFAALFRNGMKESEENRLVLSDIEPAIFEKLLSFIYTGVADMHKEEAFQLLAAADRFGLERLKILSEIKLNSCLSLENASDILTFADTYNLQGLKLNAHRVLNDYAENVPGRKFLRIRRSKPDLNNEAYTKKASAVVKSRSNVNQKETEDMDKTAFPCRRTTAVDVGADHENNFLPNVHSYCRTEIHIFESEAWLIKNFKLKDYSNSGHLFSPGFTGEKFSWFMEVCANRWCRSCREANASVLNLRLTLIPNEETKNVIPVEWELEILDGGGQKMDKIRSQFVFSDMLTYQIRVSLVPSFLFVHRSFAGNDLTFCSTISAYDSVLVEGSHFSIPKCQLATDIYSLLEGRKFTDVTIKIQNELFPCHRAILSCNSPVFASLFQDKSNEDTVVLIDDIKPCIFKRILFLMYSGKRDFTLPEASALLSVSKKYQLFKTSRNVEGSSSSHHKFPSWCTTLLQD